MTSTTSPNPLLATPYDLSTNCIERFRQDGFIKLKDVLMPQHLRTTAQR